MLAQMMIRQSIATGHGDTVADLIGALEPEIERLRAELAACREDAERYRWVRGDVPEHSVRWARWELRRWDGKCWHSLQRAALDAAIDAARKESK
jgi:hypothetical protein